MKCEEIKKEEMIQCMKCCSWTHTRCARIVLKVKGFFGGVVDKKANGPI